MEYTDGGTRTRTTLSGQRILSPLRLPFRHIGYILQLPISPISTAGHGSVRRSGDRDKAH
jgi:hypothetical protein